jgi:hypothetical protein
MDMLSIRFQPVTPMKTLFTLLSFVVLGLLLPTASFAKRPQKQQPAAPDSPELRIVEASAVSVTVTVGKTGDEHFTYKVTDATKVTLNGAPIFARDLKAGMMAKFTLTPDHSTAIAIDAKDAPAHPDKHRVG